MAWYLETQMQDEEAVLFVRVVGKLTHEDYTHLTPLLDEELENIEHEKMLFDALAFEGWADPLAVIDDLKIGLKYDHVFDKIAIVSHSHLLQLSVKVASFFMHGEMRTFENQNDAYAWL
jgi:hypothetical protein